MLFFVLIHALFLAIVKLRKKKYLKKYFFNVLKIDNSIEVNVIYLMKV
jgi:hypothetical protein